jgi:simple sugar transport system substrate-binding protein
MTVAFITHAAPGDTFWDIVRKGAEAAAAKDNVTLRYASDADGGGQATLVQNAIDSKVDAIAVTLAKPTALEPRDPQGAGRGHPWSCVQRRHRPVAGGGALGYFGSDDGAAGEEAASVRPPMG